MGGDLSSPTNAVEATVTCPNCGTVMPASAAFCPVCGWPMRPVPVRDRALATLAYLTFIPAAALLLLPAFRRARFVRFHAWQSILLWAVFFVVTLLALFFSNIAAAMIFLLIGILATLAMVFLWIVLSVKAWQGERFGLPFFGTLAGRMR
jgi:uncharacterized membrane protein